MKKIIEVKEIPEEVIPACTEEIETFVCDEDGCDFKTENEEDAEQHQGKHAVKKEMTVDGLNLYYFESKEKAECYLKTRLSEYGADRTYVRWVDKGWYHLIWEQEPCRRGCCTDSVVTLESVKSLISELQKTADNNIKKADSLSKAIVDDLGKEND